MTRPVAHPVLRETQASSTAPQTSSLRRSRLLAATRATGTGRMFGAGMLELLTPSSTPTFHGRPATAEFFGVLKEATEIRQQILDRRRRNDVEKSLELLDFGR